jgi:sulfur-carrier protein
VATVRLDGMLSEFVSKRELTLDAPTVEGLIDALEHEFPRLKHRLRDETRRMRQFVRVYVNGEEIGALSGLQTPLAPTDSVEILHSIAGG